MKEKRHHKRFTVNVVNIHGKIQFANADILNISVGGALFQTNKRLNMGRNYLLRLENSGKVVNVQGTIVYSTLSGTLKHNKELIPVYTSGMQFRNLSDEKMNELADFIQEHVIQYQNKECQSIDQLKVKKRSGLRLYVRFLIEAPEKATLHIQDAYRVKKINLRGMLIDSEHALEPEHRLPMEMTLQKDKVIFFLGRIVTCNLISKKKPKRYEVGTEFINLSNQDKQTLQDFISSLDNIDDM